MLHIELLQLKTQVYMCIEILPSAICLITRRHFICHWTNINSDKETNWSIILRINGVTGDKCMHQFYCWCAGSPSCNCVHVSTCGGCVHVHSDNVGLHVKWQCSMCWYRTSDQHLEVMCVLEEHRNYNVINTIIIWLMLHFCFLKYFTVLATHTHSQTWKVFDNVMRNILQYTHYYTRDYNRF